METRLHQQLKSHYAAGPEDCERQLGSYRIDVVAGEELIEIQCSGLAAIRDKVKDLTIKHRLRLVKPVPRKVFAIRKKWSKTVSQKFDSVQGSWLNVFEELIHFVTVFPRTNLTLELLLVDLIETRRPGRGRRRGGDRVVERELTDIVETICLRQASDLFGLLPIQPPEQFTTATLASQLECPRWLAQKIAYCLRQTGAVDVVGKQGNAWIYKPAQSPAARSLSKSDATTQPRAA